MAILKTVANNIDTDIGLLIKVSTTYLSETDPSLMDILRELDKLSKVNAAKSSALRIRYAALVGDRELGEYWARNAEHLHAEKNDIQLGLLVLYSNLGYFSDCRGPLAHLTDPQVGIPSQMYNQMMGNGAFHLLMENYTKAKRMGIVNLPESVGYIPLAVEVMDAWNETDEDYVTALDLAGTIMRKRKLFVTSTGFMNKIVYPSDGGLPYCKITFTVAVDLETSIDMTCEYLEALSTSKQKIPQSMSFEFLSESEL